MQHHFSNTRMSKQNMMPPIQSHAAIMSLPRCMGGRSSGRGSKFLAGISSSSAKGSDESARETGLSDLCIAGVSAGCWVGNNLGSFLRSSHPVVDAAIGIR